jgi:hypothetical protein
MPNLPKIPESLVKSYSDTLNNPYITSPIKTVVYNQKSVDTGVHQRFNFDENLATWIRNNIVDQWQDNASGISTTTGPCQGPHVDKRRFFNLIYLLDPGGDNVRTVFYKPKSHNIKFNHDSGFFLNYDDLEIIESHQLKSCSWNFLYTGTIHSVENITRVRASVQLGLMFDISDELLLR